MTDSSEHFTTEAADMADAPSVAHQANHHRATSAVAPKVRIEDVGRTFRSAGGEQVTALEHLSLEIGEGEFCCLVGPSGCGKSTLLRIVADLEQPSSGAIAMRHDDPSKPLTAMVFQEHAIFPWMNVTRNVEYGLRMRGLPRTHVRRRAQEFIDKTGLTGFEKAYPHQLSGGMRQRVSIARAFATDPEILVMDEPFGALDELNKHLLQNELIKIWEESGKTVLFITHSIDEAIGLGDRVLVMSARPGLIKASIPVPFSRPRGDMYELKGDPQFASLAERIWGLLEDEVLAARRLEGAGHE